MPVHRVEAFPETDPEGRCARIWLDSSSYREVTWAQIDGSQITDRDLQAAWATNALQNELDTTVKRTSLPADDPDRLADPGLPWYYWSSGNNITVSEIGCEVTWDADILMFHVTIWKRRSYPDGFTG